jgi:uncharacterized protein (DUF1778 family)
MINQDRTERIPVPVSADEKKIIQTKAHQANMTTAEFIRFLALSYAPTVAQKEQS